MYKIFTVCFLSLLIPPLAYAQSDDIKSYYSAYNFCSPEAQRQTMRTCHYQRLVEGYYTSCMSQKGFGDSDDSMDNERYAKYLQTYKQCSVIANSAAQNQCNYGVVYKGYYNKCMSSYGFDSNGESIAEKPAPPDESPIPDKKVAKKRNVVGRFFDSII